MNLVKSLSFSVCQLSNIFAVFLMWEYILYMFCWIYTKVLYFEWGAVCRTLFQMTSDGCSFSLLLVVLTSNCMPCRKRKVLRELAGTAWDLFLCPLNQDALQCFSWCSIKPGAGCFLTPLVVVQKGIEQIFLSTQSSFPEPWVSSLQVLGLLLLQVYLWTLNLFHMIFMWVCFFSGCWQAGIA